jgi:tetratricopeptide (TPR) repeat protein
MSFVWLVCLLAPPSVSEAVTFQAPGVSPKPSPSTELYEKAINALTEGNLKKAEQYLQETLNLSPTHVGALMVMAELTLKRGETKASEGYLKQALEVAPKNAAVQQVWGRFLQTQKKYSEAEAAYKRGIELQPKLLGLYMNLGNLYLGPLGKPEEAVGIFQKGIEIDASKGGLHYSLGLAFVATQNLEEATRAFRKAGELSPKNPLAFQALGRIYTAQKSYDQALEAFTKALEIHPKLITAFIARGDVYVIQKKDGMALKEYEAALAIKPGLASIYVKIGQLHERNARTQEAAKTFRTAINLDPKQFIALNNLAWISAQHHQDLDEALEWAKEAVALSPNTPAFQDTLGWVYRARGELTEAALVLEKATAQTPQISDVFYHLGIVREEQGQTQQAIEAYHKALTIQPDFPEANDARQRIQNLEAP